MADEEIRVSVGVYERSEAREARVIMAGFAAEDLKLRDLRGGRGLADVPSFAVAGVVAANAVADLWSRIRKNRMCREIIYVGKDGEISINRDCSVKDGRIIIFWNGPYARVEIHDVPPGIDITRIAETIVKSGADAVKAAAEALGAVVDGPYRGGEKKADDDR